MNSRLAIRWTLAIACAAAFAAWLSWTWWPTDTPAAPRENVASIPRVEKNSPPQNKSKSEVTRLVENMTAENALATIRTLEALSKKAPPQKPITAEDAGVSPEDFQRVEWAVAKLREVTRVVEIKNLALLERVSSPESSTVLYALSAPTKDQIAEISVAMSAQLKPFDQGPAAAWARKRLQQFYDETVSLPKPFRVLYLSVPTDPKESTLLELDADSTADLKLQPDASFRPPGRARVTVNKDPSYWQNRYGHLLKF